MNEIVTNCKKLPSVLTKDELYDLFIQMKNGDILAKEKIVLHNMRLVFAIIKKYYSSGISYEDLVSVGNMGLIKAINNFDISKNLEFSTYASVCINNEILMLLRKEKWNLKVISFDNVCKVFDNGDVSTYSDVLSSDEDIIMDYEDKNIYQIILDIINKLPDIERLCITLSFGINGYDKISQRDIAVMLKMQQPNVSKIIKKAFIKIRAELIKVGILENEVKELVKSI